VDSFHPVNVGELMIATLFLHPAHLPVLWRYCRMQASMWPERIVLLWEGAISSESRCQLLLHANATVTICHSRTKNLKEICRTADVLVAAIGKAHFITEEYIKPGAVVVDVGINRTEDGKMTGDVDFERVAPLCSYITPVPAVSDP
jgi:methylenetetrahydrofolate dehydrogenase (NADP+)/methenyltetrahydrofolate cyclohydrolase